MENASKALIMAGEILIAILILTLLLYAWGKYSEYKNEEAEIDNIENVAKFNEQFTNYDRKDVEGHEILTLINKIVDYNERKTTDSLAQSDTYNPIKITIKKINQSELTYGTEKPVLFISTEYKDDVISAKNRNTAGSFKHDIIDTAEKAMNTLPGVGNNTSKANKVAKDIERIFLQASDSDDQWTKSASLYNSYVGTKITKDVAKTKFIKSGEYYKAACICYEYMQFKRCFFECIEVKYEPSGRVSQMDFKYSGIK